MSVTSTWEALERLPYPERGFLDQLNPGATDEQIREVEEALGRALPPDLVASLKRHNGIRPVVRGETYQWIFTPLELYSCAAIVRQWEASVAAIETDIPPRQVPDTRVKPFWFVSPSWVPVVMSGGGLSGYVVDLDPGPGGTHGQVLNWDRGFAEVVQPSWVAFLEMTLELWRTVPVQWTGELWLFEAEFAIADYRGFGGQRDW